VPIVGTPRTERPMIIRFYCQKGGLPVIIRDEVLESFEKVYPEELRMTAREKQEFFSEQYNSLGIWMTLQREGDIPVWVAETFGTIARDLYDPGDTDQRFQGDVKQYPGSFYIYSTTVLPAFQGKGYAHMLRAYLLGILRASTRYTRISGHATTRKMLHIAQEFGAVPVGEAHDGWYGSPRTAQFYVGDI
jgi:GNAT superfamily N-acetyltransferase